MGAEPSVLFIKDIAQGNDWNVYHRSTGTEFARLNTNGGFATDTNRWNSHPTSTLITFGVSGHVNGPDGSGGYLCYAWTPKAGISAFGSYSGNGGSATNTITYANSNSFTARFIMIKRKDTTGGWLVFDKFRSGDGEWTTGNYADLNQAESSLTAWGTTATSTGFTFDTGTTDGYINHSSGTYVYMAFA